MTIHLYVSPTPHDAPHIEWEIVCEDGCVITDHEWYWDTATARREANFYVGMSCRSLHKSRVARAVELWWWQTPIIGHGVIVARRHRTHPVRHPFDAFCGGWERDYGKWLMWGWCPAKISVAA